MKVVIFFQDGLWRAASIEYQISSMGDEPIAALTNLVKCYLFELYFKSLEKREDLIKSPFSLKWKDGSGFAIPENFYSNLEKPRKILQEEFDTSWEVKIIGNKTEEL